MFLKTSLLASSSYHSAIFLPPAQLYAAHNNLIHHYDSNTLQLLQSHPFNLPILKIQSLPNSNNIVIVFNDLSLSIYSFKSNPIELIYTTQLVNYKTPQH